MKFENDKRIGTDKVELSPDVDFLSGWISTGRVYGLLRPRLLTYFR